MSYENTPNENESVISYEEAEEFLHNARSKHAQLIEEIKSSSGDLTLSSWSGSLGGAHGLGVTTTTSLTYSSGSFPPYALKLYTEGNYLENFKITTYTPREDGTGVGVQISLLDQINNWVLRTNQVVVLFNKKGEGKSIPKSLFKEKAGLVTRNSYSAALPKEFISDELMWKISVVAQNKISNLRSQPQPLMPMDYLWDFEENKPTLELINALRITKILPFHKCRAL